MKTNGEWHVKGSFLFYGYECFACTYLCALLPSTRRGQYLKGDGFVGTGVRGSCELPCECWELNLTRFSVRTASGLYFWTISPDSIKVFLGENFQEKYKVLLRGEVRTIGGQSLNSLPCCMSHLYVSRKNLELRERCPGFNRGVSDSLPLDHMTPEPLHAIICPETSGLIHGPHTEEDMNWIGILGFNGSQANSQ